MWPEDQTTMLEDQATREAMVLSLQYQLKDKNAEIEAMKGKYKNVVFIFLYLWLV